MSRARAAKAPATPVIDIVVKSPLWKAERGVKALLLRATAEAAAMVSTTHRELAIVLTDDSGMRALNRTWRGKDEPTNVLSFPASNAPAARPKPGGTRGPPRLLGDIVIAYETTAREAITQHKPFKHHVAHLAVHGFLHLLGYDHEDDEEAKAMEGLEVAVLRRLDMPNPYMIGDAEA